MNLYMCSMYSDDLILEDSYESEEQFDKFVQSVNSWCKNSQLELETEKIKRAKWCDKVNELKIDGKTVERVSEQKYLGTIIDDKTGTNTFDLFEGSWEEIPERRGVERKRFKGDKIRTE